MVAVYMPMVMLLFKIFIQPSPIVKSLIMKLLEIIRLAAGCTHIPQQLTIA